MRFVFDALTLWGPRLAQWTAKTLIDEAETESLDEGRVRGDLLELQQRYDTGQMEEQEYDRQEIVLLERLSAIREAKAQQI